MKKQTQCGNDTCSNGESERGSLPRRHQSEHLQRYEKAIGRCLDRELSHDKDVRALRASMFQRFCGHFGLDEDDVEPDVASRGAFTFRARTPIGTPYRLVEGFLATELAWAERLPLIPGNLKITRRDPHSRRDVEGEYPATPFFRQLKEVAGKVAKRVGETEAAAVQWLLSGGHPSPVSALSGDFRISRDFSSLSRIHLSIDPYCSKEQVADFYEELRQTITGNKRARALRDDTLAEVIGGGDPRAWKTVIEFASSYYTYPLDWPKRLAKWYRKLLNPRYHSLTSTPQYPSPLTNPLLKTYFTDHFGQSIQWESLCAYTAANVLQQNPNWRDVTYWFFGYDASANNFDFVGEIIRALQQDDPDVWHDVLRRLPILFLGCTSDNWRENAEYVLPTVGDIADMLNGMHGLAVILTWRWLRLGFDGGQCSARYHDLTGPDAIELYPRA